eukprot:TCALIF_03195-PA protein Name:"Similar to Ndufa7 NADH dehydrogenase [ubiquinone] 1 alpha subcomplex subunit 7 (Mus musculus)" AED:0.39 eAED:0.39 QI:208/1/0.5/1/1/1/2/0/111
MYMSKVQQFRDISPVLQKFRNFLNGRELVNPVRFAPNVAPLSPDDPNLPVGPAHKLAGNYYFTRDARREVQLPNVVADNGPIKALGSGDGSVVSTSKPGPKTPGQVFNYSS